MQAARALPCAMLLLALGPAVHAQDAPSQSRFALWLSEGAGLSTEGIGFVVSLSGTIGGRHLVSARMAGGFELVFFPSRSPAESVVDVGVLYGRTWPDGSGSGHTSIAAGLAYVEGVRRGAYIYGPGMGCSFFCGSTYDERPFRTVGIPVEARISLAPLRFVGIGVGLFGNLNPVRPFVGGAVHVHLGKLR